MKNLVILILLVIVAYFVYTSGILTRAVQTVQTAVPSLPGGDTTPEIIITVYSPYGTGAKTSTVPAAAPLPTRNVVMPTATPAPTGTPLPAIDAPEAPTALPVVITPPPPTIVVPEIPPTLAAENTPTPSSVFTITLDAPHDGDTLRASPTLVIGTTAPNAVVSINDTVGLAGPDGHFALAVPLQPGPNVLEVIASKPNGDQTYVIVTVLYQP
jgi:hypothetical protein